MVWKFAENILHFKCFDFIFFLCAIHTEFTEIIYLKWLIKSIFFHLQVQVINWNDHLPKPVKFFDPFSFVRVHVHVLYDHKIITNLEYPIL